ncbi:MAG: multi-sensor hybrid histidine kinase / cell cycle control histidine kinase CckA [Fibrobacteres bacterium]|nr:multi-sensor hybrid histidine kinase / cell cycle control histidine kinase CckA [Fibrobacterota bacterium]
MDEISNKPTVLVVDDQALMLRLCHAVFEGLGYQVLEARSGEDAWDILEREHSRISLLLTDIRMGPGMDGVELATRARTTLPDLDIIVMSGFAEEESVKRLIGSSGFRFIHKPFTVTALREVVSLGKDRKPV